MRNPKELLREEPVAILAFVGAVITVLTAFDIVELTQTQLNAVLGIVVAAFALCRWLVYSQATVDKLISTTKMLTREAVLSDIEELAEVQREKRKSQRAASTKAASKK